MASSKRSNTVGYARVSSIPQHTQLQRDALAEVDCVRVFEDKISRRTKDRPGLLARRWTTCAPATHSASGSSIALADP